jgi:DNA-binding NarL/FixJ family response regulator
LSDLSILKNHMVWGGVAKLLAEGKSSKEIAELSYISRYTVRRHRDNIRRKLELKGLVDLVRYAMEHGYISDNS